MTTARLPRQRRKAARKIQAEQRVAIYTRKSTEKGLDLEFNSLDSQREAIEAYIQSQRGEGWAALPERYDDGGFSGKNTERPAFQRLLSDIEAGGIDIVAVYKIDRLSRSLMDFTQLMALFQEHGVTFVSVTQQFSTTNSVGRMTLNLLATFAEFERETIAERTRDKVAASRRRGQWTGGRPVLGYDVQHKKLVVNPDEAEQVRAIFQLYLELGSLLPVVEELNGRGWTTKSWQTKAGKFVQGRRFNKNSVHGLLTNPLYLGKIRSDGELYDGQHDPIVEQDLWDAVQSQLRTKTPRSRRRMNFTTLLQGLLRCGKCGAGMTSQYTVRGERRYGYYLCLTMHKEGAKACPKSRAPSGEMDQFVVDRIRAIGRDPELIQATIDAATKANEERLPQVLAEFRQCEQQQRSLSEERNNLVDAIATGGKAAPSLAARVGVLDEELAKVAKRTAELRADLVAIETASIDEEELKAALEAFDPIWDELLLKEQARLLSLLIEQITFNGDEEEVSITFHPSGIKQLNLQSKATP